MPIPVPNFVLPFVSDFTSTRFLGTFSPFPVTHRVQSVFHNIPYNKPVRGATATRSVHGPGRLLGHLLLDFSRLKNFGPSLGPTHWIQRWFPRGKAAWREAHHAQPLALTLGVSRAIIPVPFYTPWRTLV